MITKRPKTYIINCEITEISDTDENGKLLLKPVQNKTQYANVFKTLDEVTRFLTGEVVPTVQVEDGVRAV